MGEWANTGFNLRGREGLTDMPELPEVEVLVRHLAPLLKGRTIGDVCVNRARIVVSNSPAELSGRLKGATFTGLTRRGKYLLFALRAANGGGALLLVGHLGMTGRMYLLADFASKYKPPAH